MKLDFWRAAGVTAGAVTVSSLIWLVTYPLWAVSVPAFIVKDSLLTLAISAWFAWIYFERQTPSTRRGFGLGLYMLGVPLILSFVMGLAAALTGFPEYGYPASDMPEWYQAFSFCALAALVPLATTFTGWYLAKRK